MYLIARFPNVVDDFGEPVYLQTQRAGINKNITVATVTTDATKTLAALLDSNSFPGALVPSSALDILAAGDLGVVAPLIGDVTTTDLYKTIADFKKDFSVVSYKSQQGAMVVDHWVHYDGFMVVEMGEVKTRW
jgi:hypothetical protein